MTYVYNCMKVLNGIEQMKYYILSLYIGEGYENYSF